MILIRPYKSTSLGDLIVICSNVPNRDVLKAILTELSHRQEKQARTLEAILVRHLANHSGDVAVVSLNAAHHEHQPTLSDPAKPQIKNAGIKPVAGKKPEQDKNPKRSSNPMTGQRPTPVAELKTGNSQKITAHAEAGKTSEGKNKANTETRHPPTVVNKAIADKAMVEKRELTKSRQQNKKPGSSKDQAKVPSKRSRPAFNWVRLKPELPKIAMYVCAFAIVVASFSYGYFLYDERMQTSTKADDNQARQQTSNKNENDDSLPGTKDLARNIKEPAQPIIRNNLAVNDPAENNLADNVPQIVETADSGNLVEEIQVEPGAIVKSDPAQNIQIGLDAYNKGDYSTALREFRALSEQGNTDAQYYLGLMFDNGQGVAADYREAMDWYRQASEQGNALAQLALGIKYYEGEVVVEDFEEAAKWYGMSAGQGNQDAQNRLGFMYEKGLGVAQDYGQAAKWYSKAAEQGNVNAQKNLSTSYFLGQGMPQDNVYAHMWADIAASQGHKTAIKIRDLVVKKMSASELSKAKELAKQCVSKNYKGC